jgi:ribonuclease VapC
MVYIVGCRGHAFSRFGKGHHPARLNLADCFSYALARTRNVPLLFKGDDFAQTDILPAWRQ